MKIHKAALRRLFAANDQILDTAAIYRIGESLIPYVMRMTEEQDGSGLQPGFA